MPRVHRELAVPRGSVVHVTNRGNDRADIFRADGDRQVFLELLGGQAATRGWRCYAYCLMTNHYHLMLAAPEGGLSEGMHAIGTAYAKLFNRAYTRVGHVFQGRFAAVVVEGEQHTLELARYIAMNPVRAGLCERPDEWPWSSYTVLARGLRSPSALGCEPLLQLFGSPRRRALENLRQFVAAATRHESASRV